MKFSASHVLPRYSRLGNVKWKVGRGIETDYYSEMFVFLLFTVYSIGFIGYLTFVQKYFTDRPIVLVCVYECL